MYSRSASSRGRGSCSIQLSSIQRSSTGEWFWVSGYEQLEWQYPGQLRRGGRSRAISIRRCTGSIPAAHWQSQVPDLFRIVGIAFDRVQGRDDGVARSPPALGKLFVRPAEDHCTEHVQPAVFLDGVADHCFERAGRSLGSASRLRREGAERILPQAGIGDVPPLSVARRFRVRG